MSLTILKAEKSIFVIELPPYRVPQAKTLWLSTWEKGKGFVRKAGTFIFGGSVVIWLLNYAYSSGFGVDMGRQLLSDDWWVYRTVICTARLRNVASCSIPLTGF